jgi:NAD(P)-dependent dehydrogenase (short-subunit alcohol dehydrogenase family)
VCDLADADSISRAFEQAGPLDAAVNAAAIGQQPLPVEQLDRATIDQIININFRGLLLCMQQEIPLIRQHGRGGAIVTFPLGVGSEALPN